MKNFHIAVLIVFYGAGVLSAENIRGAVFINDIKNNSPTKSTKKRAEALSIILSNKKINYFSNNKISLSNEPNIFIPTKPRKILTRYPWKRRITATVFWVGEPTSQNNPVSNYASSWDMNWTKNYGGFDDPNKKARVNYRPKKFIPQQNPFYIALPYNDILPGNRTKLSAKKYVPWFKHKFKRHGRTILKGTWVAIRHKNRVAFAQWEDCGPFDTDDPVYVFGKKNKPRNRKNKSAGIDISPAVRDYLKSSNMAVCDWRFVGLDEVQDGPWKKYGDNNDFVLKRRKLALISK